MDIAIKFEFESRSCVGKILASQTFVVFNRNRLIIFENMSISVRYLFFSNYCELFTKRYRGEIIRFFLLGCMTRLRIFLLCISKCDEELKATQFSARIDIFFIMVFDKISSSYVSLGVMWNLMLRSSLREQIDFFLLWCLTRL